MQGRTFSYSDTQHYRVGPNYLQLPINSPRAKIATNQRDGPHEVTPTSPAHEPVVSGRVQRHAISRENNYTQAGERYRTFEPWERDDLVTQLSQCNHDIQARVCGISASATRTMAEGSARASASTPRPCRPSQSQ